MTFPNLASAGFRAALLLGLACLAGCAPHQQANHQQANTAPAISIAFVTNSSTDFWTLARKGVEKAEKDMPNVSVQFVMPADGAAATQKAQIDDLTAKGIQGLAMDPIDPKNQTAYINGIAAKIPLITFDSDDSASNRLCYNGPAILSAVQDGGKVGKVKIIAFDDDPATLAGVKSGAIYGTVVQQPFQFGYQSVKTLSEIVQGNQSGIPANKLDIIPTQPIKQGDVDAFQAEVQKEQNS